MYLKLSSCSVCTWKSISLTPSTLKQKQRFKDSANPNASQRFSSQTHSLRGSFSFLGCQIIRLWGKERQKAKLKKQINFWREEYTHNLCKDKRAHWKIRGWAVLKLGPLPSASPSSSDSLVLGNLQADSPDLPELRGASWDDQLGKGPEERTSPLGQRCSNFSFKYPSHQLTQRLLFVVWEGANGSGWSHFGALGWLWSELYVCYLLALWCGANVKCLACPLPEWHHLWNNGGYYVSF